MTTERNYYADELVATVVGFNWVMFKPAGTHEFKVLQYYCAKIGTRETIRLTNFIQLHCTPGYAYEVSTLNAWLNALVGNTAKLLEALGRTSVHNQDLCRPTHDRSAFSPLVDVYDTIQLLDYWQDDNLFVTYADT